MNDLPVSPVSTGNTTPVPQQSGASFPVAPTGSVHKEMEIGQREAPSVLKDIASQEIELPSEVASSGVRVHPTRVAIPHPVATMGVKPAGQNIPPSLPTIAMPLSDDQITQGLSQGVNSSWRWLSEWCLKRMKQLHIAFTIAHGKLVRQGR